jgi:hypothetical protein
MSGDQARGALDTPGLQKILGARVRLTGEAQGSHQAHERLAQGLVVIDDRNHTLLQHRSVPVPLREELASCCGQRHCT